MLGLSAGRTEHGGVGGEAAGVVPGVGGDIGGCNAGAAQGALGEAVANVGQTVVNPFALPLAAFWAEFDLPIEMTGDQLKSKRHFPFNAG